MESVISSPKQVYKLPFNGEVIYSSTKKRVPKTVLRRYWPEIADDKENLDALGTRPVYDEEKHRHLEWESAP